MRLRISVSDVSQANARQAAHSGSPGVAISKHRTVWSVSIAHPLHTALDPRSILLPDVGAPTPAPPARPAGYEGDTFGANSGSGAQPYSH